VREGADPFVLGHARYTKAIHGGKAKNDRLDAHEITVLLRGGMLPQASVYQPACSRASAPPCSGTIAALPVRTAAMLTCARSALRPLARGAVGAVAHASLQEREG
jgi:hypothetical protein